MGPWHRPEAPKREEEANERAPVDVTEAFWAIAAEFWNLIGLDVQIQDLGCSRKRTANQVEWCSIRGIAAYARSQQVGRHLEYVFLGQLP